MPTALRLRRGTTAQHATFTGLAGEATVDTSKNTLVVHDGVTAGGIALARGDTLGMRNRIINGDMRIDQRNNGAAVTVTIPTYLLDRYMARNSTGTGVVTIQQAVLGNSKSVRVTATNAVTALTGINAVFPLQQRVESQNCFDLNSKIVTLSFRVETNWAGSIAVAINSGFTRSYVTNAVVVVGTNNVSVTVPFEATTVLTNDSSIGVVVTIGANNEDSARTTTVGNWLAGEFYCSTLSTQWAKTTGNFINVTNVQLEEGSVATPFERRPIGLELALCQRYFENISIHQTTASTAFILANGTTRFAVPKRVAPQIVFFSSQTNTPGVAAEFNPGSTFVADRSINSTSSFTDCITTQIAGTATPGNDIRYKLTASSEL